MKKLENCISLSHKVKIYVPSTVNVSESFNNEQVVKSVLSSLAGYFGGATSYPAFGAWVVVTGELVTERITICEAFCDEASLSTNIESIYTLCRDMKAKMSQEAIALEIDNVMYFI